MEKEAYGLQKKMEKPICDVQTQTAHKLESSENAVREFRWLAMRADWWPVR